MSNKLARQFNTVRLKKIHLMGSRYNRQISHINEKSHSKYKLTISYINTYLSTIIPPPPPFPFSVTSKKISKNRYSGVIGLPLGNTVNQGSNRSLENYMTTKQTLLPKRPVYIGCKQVLAEFYTTPQKMQPIGIQKSRCRFSGIILHPIFPCCNALIVLSKESYKD